MSFLLTIQSLDKILYCHTGDGSKACLYCQGWEVSIFLGALLETPLWHANCVCVCVCSKCIEKWSEIYSKKNFCLCSFFLILFVCNLYNVMRVFVSPCRRIDKCNWFVVSVFLLVGIRNT